MCINDLIFLADLLQYQHDPPLCGIINEWKSTRKKKQPCDGGKKDIKNFLDENLKGKVDKRTGDSTRTFRIE